MSVTIQMRRRATRSESIITSVLPLVDVGAAGGGLAADTRTHPCYITLKECYSGLQYCWLGDVVGHCFPRR